jgi:hypothetical protein
MRTSKVDVCIFLISLITHHRVQLHRTMTTTTLPLGVLWLLSLYGWMTIGILKGAVTAFRPLVPSSIKSNNFRNKLTSVNMAPTVTKEDLLGARDAVDKLLHEKACGKRMVS